MSRTPRTLGALAGALALSLVVASPAAAQFAKPDNASRDLKNASQLEVKETQMKLKNPKNVLGLTLKGFKAGVAKGNFAPEDLQELFADMERVQAEMAFLVQDGVRTLRGHANQLLVDLASQNENFGEGQYPENFYRGSNSHLDTFQFNMREITRKSQKLMRQRLRALAKNLRKNTDVNLTSVVGPEVPLPSLAINEGVLVPEEHLLSADLLMAYSREEIADDGELCVSGTAMKERGDIGVQVFDAAGILADSTVVAGATITDQDRWTACFNDLPEGNYTVVVSQDGNQATNEIGIR